MLSKIEIIIENIERQAKTTFVSAMIFGLFAHYFVITNKLTNHDDIRETCCEMTQLSWGRWFIGVASEISGRMSMPFNCLLALVFVAFAAGFVVVSLEIKSTVVAGLVGALMETVPSMTFSFLYNSSADPYGLAILLVAIGSYVAIKLENRYVKFILPILLFTLSLGIYQAYLGFAMGIFILDGVSKLLYEKVSFKKTFRDESRYLLIGVASLFLYLVITKLLNAVTGTEMSDYQGMDKMGRVNFATLPYQIRLSFVKPLGYFFTNDRGVHYKWLGFVICVIFALTAIIFVVQLVKQKLGKLELTLIVVLLLCLPISAGFAYIEGAANVHLLLTYSYLVLPFFVLLVIDRTNVESGYISAYQGCSLLALVLLIFNYVTLSNKVYSIDYYTYEESYSYAQTVASVIRTTPGYREDSTLYFIGTPASKSIALEEFYEDDSRVQAFDGTGLDRDFNEEYSRNSFYWYYLGLTNSIVYIDQDDVEKMGMTNLQLFPCENSVRAVDGGIVIRFE